MNNEPIMAIEEGKLKVFKLDDKIQIFDPRNATNQEQFLQFANEAQVLVQYCIDNDVQYAETNLTV